MKTTRLTAVIPAIGIAICLAITASCSLRRRAETPRITLDCSPTAVLDRFDDDRVCEALLRHVCASAAWRVTGDSGIMVAEKRCRGPRTDAEHAAFAKKPTHLSVKLHFDAPRARVPSVGGQDVSVAEPGAPAVRVALSRARDASGTLDSLVLLKGKRLVLEILECNPDPDRPLTRKAIDEVSAEFSAIRSSVDVVLQRGYLRKWLPDNSIRESPADLPIEIADVREGLPSGVFWVSGYANTGEKGYVTIRSFDASTGEELGGAYNHSTVEYIGWSANLREKFFFESEVTVPGDRAKKKVRFEVWFHANGKKDRRLLETTRVVPTWTR